jgi:hypothetical protein
VETCSSLNHSYNNLIALSSPAAISLAISLKSTKWVLDKLSGDVKNNFMLLPTKNEKTPHHGLREKVNLNVGDGGIFLKTCALDRDKNYWFCSSCYNASLLQVS